MQVFASVGRILIGVALLVYASYSSLPGWLMFLGWLSVISGIVFFFLKQETFSNLVRTVINQYGKFAQFAGGFVVLLGLSVLYAVW